MSAARLRGVTGFSSLLRTLAASPCPFVFLPGVIHLPTVPAHRKINRIDLGTADKVCVAALALAQRLRARGLPLAGYHGCLVELGSAFTACVVLRERTDRGRPGRLPGPAGLEQLRQHGMASWRTCCRRWRNRTCSWAVPVR